MNELAPELQRTRAWLVGPDARIADAHDECRGASIGWIEDGARGAPFAYPEITGYALAAWTWLRRLEPRAEEIDAAGEAAAWLARLFERHGAFPGVVPLRADWRDARAELAYLFDAGVILHGLVRSARELGSAHAAALAPRVAAWIRARAAAASITAAQELREPSRTVAGTRWSLHAGPHLAKVALGLIDFSRHFDAPEDEDLARALLVRALAQRQERGRCSTESEGTGTQLHPHAYALEGFWAGARAFGDERFSRAALVGTTWLLEELDRVEGGAAPSAQVTGHERGDVRFQALRLGALLRWEGLLDASWDPALARLRARALEHRLPDEDPRRAGAFAFRERMFAPRHANVWVSLFALQALHLDDCRRRGAPFAFDAGDLF